LVSRRTLLLPLVIGTLSLVGCATGRIDAQWSDPQASGQPLGGSTVLVVCQAAEQTVIRICQDQLAAQLRLMGVTTVMAESLTASADKSTEKAIAVARELGAKAVLYSALSPVTTLSNSGPFMGFGFGSGGYRSGAGFGMSFPIGSSAQTSSTSYSSDTTLTSVASGRLIWSGKASTISQEVPDQIASLAKISVESARKAGML